MEESEYTFLYNLCTLLNKEKTMEAIWTHAIAAGIGGATVYILVKLGIIR